MVETMETGEPEVTSLARDASQEGLSRSAAAKFAEKWKDATDEKQQSSAFWHSFFIDVQELKQTA